MLTYIYIYIHIYNIVQLEPTCTNPSTSPERSHSLWLSHSLGKSAGLPHNTRSRAGPRAPQFFAPRSSRLLSYGVHGPRDRLDRGVGDNHLGLGALFDYPALKGNSLAQRTQNQKVNLLAPLLKMHQHGKTTRSKGRFALDN